MKHMSPTTRATRSVACAALTLSVVAMSGCVVAPGSGLTPDEARVELYEALDSTQELLGGEWENRDDPTARGCLIPLWVEGQHFPGLRLGSAPDDIAAAVTEVTEAWVEWGYRVEQTVIGKATELQGRDSVGELIIFRITSDAMTLQGESECRPK
jgi:hypothetical protein